MALEPRISDTDISFFGVIHQTSRINSTLAHRDNPYIHVCVCVRVCLVA